MSGREKYEEIVSLVSIGLNNCEIARRLGMVPSSVWHYRHTSKYANGSKWYVGKARRKQ